MHMSFSYYDYYVSCCLLPSFICVFNLIAIVSAVIQLVAGAIHQSMQLKRVVSLVYVVLVLSFILVIHAGRLYHGGVYLFLEKEADSVILAGVIDEIKENNRFTFPELGSYYKEYGDAPHNGVSIVIDGSLFYAASPGGFRVGDLVTIKYLPKSKIIMEIAPYPQLEDKSSE